MLLRIRPLIVTALENLLPLTPRMEEIKVLNSGSLGSRHKKRGSRPCKLRWTSSTISVHFVEANRYYNGVQYNQYQLKKQQEAQRMKKQLDGEKKTLGNMQESARKAGFGSAVYDP